MRKTLTAVAAVLAVAAGPVLLAGTAQAAVPLAPSAGCFTLKQVNGQWTLVPTTTGCSSTSTGTNGTGSSTSGGGTNGTSTNGTVTNNCVPAGSCTATSTGTGGRAR